MEYNKSGSRPVKRRLRKDRVFACLAVLIVIIFAVSSLISGCSKKDKKDKDKTKEADVQVTQTTPVPEQNDDYIICVDPGHGGDDPGSNYGDRTEVVDNSSDLPTGIRRRKKASWASPSWAQRPVWMRLRNGTMWAS